MERERQPKAELDQKVLERYADVFTPRRDLYAIQLRDGRYVSVKKHLNLQLVDAHLKGHITLGTYALDARSQARWLCLDADADDEWAGLIGVAIELGTQSIPSYLEQSRRGGHLWLFTPSMPGAIIRRFGQQLLREHNLNDIELFPKQDKLTTGPGSLVRLPLGRHQVSGHRYPFVTVEGEPLAPTVREQIRLLAYPKRGPQHFIDDVLSRMPQPESVSSIPHFPAPPDEGGSDPPSERIKRAVSVYDFVGEYVDLDERGRGLCPFHDDHHKSFGVNRSGNFWNCFACGTGGSILDFWSAWRELNGEDPDFVPTLRELARMLL